ncbi:phosphoethanolamine transferase [Shewanella sedimentimangrovi]|uniref:Phosphoethanolamine--lipid A transferase n=1 Tax=Shewanella sedimentimangrovi TaxID=2814293 RepID=A0ABX7R709_9GAMM|nr:phosphoethanolamine--lipid A transferase [Shewanella sedimentimangrovi]QSX38921.1 phosphoethanolamine--lipid A transferase [Shewanella sedimentimangrovi]
MFKTLSANKFTFLLALFYTCVFNIPLFEIVARGVQKQADVNWVFIASFPILLTCLLSLIFSLFSFRFLAKPFFILLTLLSSSVFFGMWKYGIVFDRPMMENIFETNPAEASMYLNWASVLNMLLTGLLPAWLIFKAPIEYRSAGKELLHKLGFMLAMVLVSGVILGVYYQNYVAFGRNNDVMKQYIVPTYFIGSAAKYVNQHYFEKPIPYTQLGTDAKQKPSVAGKPKVTVLVIGETARAMNYQYYGYGRETNAYTAKLGLAVFGKTISCGTATAQSLPCMLSRFDRDNYDVRRAKAQDSVIDVASHAGLAVTWIDNDSGCKGACDRVEHELIKLDADPALCDGESCFDQILLHRLDDKLAALDGRDSLIVLHVMGSHGPTYFRRYPDDHRFFTPDCQRSDIQNCSAEELMNTYDNTIRYTDYILAEVVSRLQAVSDKADTAMMYISDHGESLGEKGMYLHGAPYAFAPSEQIEIPWLLWLSDSFAATTGKDKNCLKTSLGRGEFSHDYLFDTLLGLLHVETSVYRRQTDALAECNVQV